ncbi:MAG: 6-phosphogluconolactonase [Planctomycetes bacterium]|nr:6-phosphogluconolactonase [Planctomycetota bacterium]
MASGKATPFELRTFPDGEAVARAAADEFARVAAAAVAERGRAAIALAGGSTPRRLYQILAERGAEAPRAKVPWDALHLFWGDERHVSPEHADSNYRMTREALLDAGLVPAANVHRIRAELADAAEAARLYEEELRAFFRLRASEWPRFDLMLLGMGADGHTASLFPGTDAVGEVRRLAASPWVEKFKTYRITLSPPVFNHAAEVLFLVTGADKAATLREVLEGEPDPARLPSQLIRPADGRCLWFADRAAAARLRGAG